MQDIGFVKFKRSFSEFPIGDNCLWSLWSIKCIFLVFLKYVSILGVIESMLVYSCIQTFQYRNFKSCWLDYILICSSFVFLLTPFLSIYTGNVWTFMKKNTYFSIYLECLICVKMHLTHVFIFRIFQKIFFIGWKKLDKFKFTWLALLFKHVSFKIQPSMSEQWKKKQLRLYDLLNSESKLKKKQIIEIIGVSLWPSSSPGINNLAYAKWGV